MEIRTFSDKGTMSERFGISKARTDLINSHIKKCFNELSADDTMVLVDGVTLLQKAAEVAEDSQELVYTIHITSHILISRSTWIS